MSSQGKERRRSVRLRPVSDLPAVARLPDDGVELKVWDVSVGGVAVVAEPRVTKLEPDTRHRLHLDLGRYGAFDLEVEVRHRRGDTEGMVGMQFVGAPQNAVTALGRYVGELLVRGAPS